MTIWRPNLAGKPGPKYQLIADAIGESIANGSLRELDRLPPQRDLAYDLDLSLNTVGRAYGEATRRGFLYGEVGRGTYVRPGGPLPAQEGQARLTRPEDGPIDFSLNLPAAGESAAALAQTIGSLQSSTSLSSFLDYQTGGVLERHGQAAATWIGQLGLEVSGDGVILTNGAQHGLMVALLAVMRPGDVLITEELTYAPIKAMAQHLGLKLFAVAMDEDGLSPDALDAACTATSAKTLYCLPTLHTPTTITMSADRRRAIAAVARRHDLVIIEDDVFGFLPPDRPAPLASFAPERTIFVTSVSKSLGPGLRVGYVHAPAKYLQPLRSAVSISCWMPPPLMAEIATLWINQGDAYRFNEFQRSEARARQQMAQRILAAHQPLSDPYGLHLWLQLPPHWRAASFRTAAESRGVKVLTGETFAVDQAQAPQAIRLCLSHEPTHARVNKGLEIVAALLDEVSDPDVLVV